VVLEVEALGLVVSAVSVVPGGGLHYLVLLHYPLTILVVAWSFLEGLYSRGLVYPVQVIASIVTNPLQLWLSPDRPASWLTLQFYRADDGGKIFREKETWWGRGFEKPACEDDQ
jgi:hypothetical protein